MFIKIKVFPNSKENKIIKRGSDSFNVYVREKPKEGRANRAVINILSSRLNIPAGKLKLVKGSRQQNKIFEINGFFK
ncbi:MAG: DUF167 domain-containing protein [bacterium]|nr:DUF167 domain-containing protein [bacterium]